METIITGSNGQLGKELQKVYPAARAVTKEELDISNVESVKAFDWENVETIINAAAYTKVDEAETDEGYVSAWRANAIGPLNLGIIARKNELTLVHISTDYVFDGTQDSPYSEEAFANPLSEYGRSKLAGELAIKSIPKHYLIRTSWVIGEGHNFVRTMLGLGAKGVEPTVVSDQIGRPAFTVDIARAIDHLIKQKCEYGIYNVTNTGDSVSWADLAREVFKAAGYDLEVKNTTTENYFADKPGVATRPLNGVLSLNKIQNTGFEPRDWRVSLKEYVENYKI